MKKMRLALPAGGINRVAGMAMLGIAVSTASLFSGCGKDETKAELMGEGDSFSGPNRQNKLDNLSDGYQTKFDIDKRDRGYNTEYLTNRGMRFFQSNYEGYKEKLKSCALVVFGTQEPSQWMHPSRINEKMGITVTSAKMVLYINVLEQESKWRRLVENFEDEDAATQRFANLELQLRKELSFTDLIGLNAGEVTAFAQAVSEAAKGLDFNSIPTGARQVYIDRKNGVGKTFMIVEPGKESAYYLDFFRQVIELHRNLRADLDRVSMKTTKSVTIQDGTLVPAEIIRGLAMLEANAKLFEDSTRQFDSIMLGRRFEESKDLAKQMSVFIVPFNATAKEIEEGLAKFESNWTKLAKTAVQDAKNHYKARGISLELSPAAYSNESGLLKLKRSLDQLMTVATAEKLNSVRVTQIVHSDSGVSINGSTLYVNVMDLRAADVDAEIARVLKQSETTERLQVQNAVIQSLRTNFAGSNVSFSWTDSELNPQSGDATLRLTRFVDAFKRRATAERLKECKTTRVIIVRNSLAQEQVVFSGEEVRINPYAMDESVLEDRILERIKSLQPVPAPTPSPSPVVVAPAAAVAPAPVPAPAPAPSPVASPSPKASSSPKK